MSLTLTRPGNRLRRAAAGAITVALAATSLALVPGSAQADPVPAPSLTWKISDWFGEHLGVQTFTGGASATDGVLTFPNGVGTSDAGNGVTSMTYGGAVRGAFVAAGSEQYSITVASPSVTVDASGNGTISADVSWTVGASSAGGPTRVALTTFNGSTAQWATSSGLRSLTTTPKWDGVLPAGSPEAIAAGISNVTRPVDGKAFSPELITMLNPGLKAHFYASTSANDPKKTPAEFKATALAPAVAVTTTSSTPAGGVVLSLAGSGFTKSTNPGDAGVYLGVAPSGSLPDVATPEGADAFAAVAYVPSALIGTNGAFTNALTIATEALDANKSYSVYTWRAHTHSTTSQDTEAPLDIDFASLGLKYTSKPVVAGSATSPYGKAVTVTATVPAVKGVVPTGNVVLTGAGTQTKALVGGKATFTLPANLSVAKRTLSIAYQGDANYTAQTTAKALTVAKDTVTISDKVTKKPTTKKSGKATITVRAKSSKIKPTGKVTVYFKKSGQKTVKTSAGTLKNGAKSVTVPKLKKKGTWKIYVTYSAGAGYSSVSSKYVGTVKVTK